ncbi:MAG: hypothetical protein IKU94_04660, partial [Bacteroidaceae bacterium]|nr:hypothetical protein [Bacteroidaceae bacterium]
KEINRRFSQKSKEINLNRDKLNIEFVNWMPLSLMGLKKYAKSYSISTVKQFYFYKITFWVLKSLISGENAENTR